MSGGSLDYVHEDVRRAAEASRASLSDDRHELVQDIAELLKAVEWTASGDYGEDKLSAELEQFCFRWRSPAMPPSKRLEAALLLVESALDDRDELSSAEKAAAGECYASLSLALENPETELRDAILGALP